MDRRPEELAEMLQAKEPKRNIIMEVFDLFSVDCINSKGLDPHLLDELIEQFNNSDNNVELLCRIIAEVQNAVTDSEKAGKELANEIMRYFNEKYSESTTVEKVAEELNVSYYYLGHFVKKHFGISVTELRNKVRVRRAKISLINTDLGITEIAGACGFENASYFSEVFTAFT